MVANVAFFFHIIDIYMENVKISERDREFMHTHLIAGFYMQQVARKEKDVTRKNIISEKSRKLLSVLYDQDGPFAHYSKENIINIEKYSRECAHFFQRSSSCVEGRNAQLSLRHHGIHRLSDLHLKALTTVHNYYIKNRNGTTPAERFFEAKHNGLFLTLLDNMDYPARPRRRCIGQV